MPVLPAGYAGPPVVPQHVVVGTPCAGHSGDVIPRDGRARPVVVVRDVPMLQMLLRVGDVTPVVGPGYKLR